MSELHAHPRSRGTPLFWRVYMLSWACLAGGALTYLSAFALNFDRPSNTLAKPLQSDQESNRTELDRAQLNAKVRSLRVTLATLRTDLARIKNARPTKVAEQTAGTTRSMALTMPLQTAPLQPDATRYLQTGSITKTATTTVPNETVAQAPAKTKEQPLIPTITAKVPVEPAPAQSAAPQKPAAKTKSDRPPRNLATAPLRSGAPPLPPYRQQRMALLNPTQAAPQSSTRRYEPPILGNTQRGAQAATTKTQSAASTDRIRTGSLPIATKVATTTSVRPAVVNTPSFTSRTTGTPTIKLRKTAAPLAALSLSQATSVTGLRASWLLLTTRHRNSFANYRPRYTKDTATGLYRLIAGPIDNRTEADRVCTTLRAQGVSCGVTNYTGTAF